MSDLALWLILVIIGAQDWLMALLMRRQLRLIGWLQHRVAELERRQYGIAMPAACPEEERRR